MFILLGDVLFVPDFTDYSQTLTTLPIGVCMCTHCPIKLVRSEGKGKAVPVHY